MAITNPALTGQSASGTTLAKYISVIWRTIVIVGGLAVLFYFAWAALDIIFSNNEPDRFKRAKDKMFNAVFGLGILILSYLIIKIISYLTGLDILNPNWPTFF